MFLSVWFQIGLTEQMSVSAEDKKVGVYRVKINLDLNERL